MKWEELKIVPNDFIEIQDDESPKFKKLQSSLYSGNMNFTRKEVKGFPKIMHNNYINVNDKKYKLIIDNLDVLKNISMLFTFKLNNIDGDMGQLLFLENSNEGNLISINIINSNKIKVNNIDDKCKEDANCKKIIENLQNSINIHNNYYNNNGDEFLAMAFHSVEGYSKIVEYNGTSDYYAYVDVGFQAAWAMVKCTTNDAPWFVISNKWSSPYGIEASDSNALGIVADWGFLSNGQVRLGGNFNNGSRKYLLIAFANEFI